MQLIGVQLDIAWEDREMNHRRVRGLLEKTPPPRGALVVLPEMFASGFSMNVGKIAEDESRLTERFIQSLARQYKSFIVAGLVSRNTDGLGRNEAVVCNPNGETVARYCKLHPYTPGKEKQHYTAGDKIVTFDWNGVVACPFICYDLRFPEIFRSAVRRGAQAFIVIASWPSPRVEHWVTLLRARAIENQALVIGVNRCGDEAKLQYPGRSLIVSPRGDILADGGANEGIISASFDLETLESYRQTLPFLDDVRDDFLPRP